MKLATVLGARPQFIKAAAVSRALHAAPGIEEQIIHTGQHFDQNMSDVFFEEMGIPAPAHHLGISGGTHGRMTGRQLEAVEEVLLAEKPDAVMVYGDTNSTLAGALAAAKLHIPVAHVEAGLRSFNRRMPEEINRVLTDHAATWLFAPTQVALDHLKQEGLTHSGAVFAGDVMYDAALIFGAEADDRSDILERLNLAPGGFRLCTCHRAENTDDPARLAAIFRALRALASDTPLVLPLHPRTRKMLAEGGDFEAMTAGLTLIDPVGFFEIIRLMRGASLVLTDSGGLQKEAYFHGTPVVVLRDETEWVELVELGWARITPPTEQDAILTAARAMEGATGDTVARPYGDGQASQTIVQHLVEGHTGA